MALTKTDKEFLEKTSELQAMKVATKMLKELPCKDHNEMIIDHEALLKNGLTGAVKSLTKTLKEHIESHEKDRLERDRGRRSAWRMFIIGAATAALSFGGAFYIAIKFGG